jgi:hypothetical protein
MVGMLTKLTHATVPLSFLLLGHGLKPLDVTFMRQIHDKVSFADHYQVRRTTRAWWNFEIVKR